MKPEFQNWFSERYNVLSFGLSGFNPKYIYLYGIVWTVNFNIFNNEILVLLQNQ